ncbi:MAG: hypothetical protein HYX69_13865 [Planctomycetia bacterium]|nr:hypothetical protein [Planctomycetia bacterium]
MGPQDVADGDATPVLTTAVHYVSRVTYVEEAIILLCLFLVAIALYRNRGGRAALLLLLGFALMPARDVVVQLSFWLDEQRWPTPSATYVANVVSFIGWLCIAGYCLALAAAKLSVADGRSKSAARLREAERP